MEVNNRCCLEAKATVSERVSLERVLTSHTFLLSDPKQTLGERAQDQSYLTDSIAASDKGDSGYQFATVKMSSDKNSKSLSSTMSSAPTKPLKRTMATDGDDVTDAPGGPSSDYLTPPTTKDLSPSLLNLLAQARTNDSSVPTQLFRGLVQMDLNWVLNPPLPMNTQALVGNYGEKGRYNKLETNGLKAGATRKTLPNVQPQSEGSAIQSKPRTTAVAPLAGPGPLTEFPLFSKLAAEIQVVAFKFMLPRAGVIEVTHLSSKARGGTCSIIFVPTCNYYKKKKFIRKRHLPLLGVCWELNKLYKRAMPIGLPMALQRNGKVNRTYRAPNVLRISAEDMLYFASFLSNSDQRIARNCRAIANSDWRKQLTHLGLYYNLFKKLHPTTTPYAFDRLLEMFPNLVEIRLLQSGFTTNADHLDIEPSFPVPELGVSCSLDLKKQRKLSKKLTATQDAWDKDPYFLSKNEPIPRIAFL
ncbi:hypothetical protein DL98DRAFT_533655 [Cadophora sp. DSE1049]|nr:hypothetical protein DL98DRAFT_533655 [Cadophora sp. DSE1049]